MILWILLLLAYQVSSDVVENKEKEETENKDDLVQSETKDPGKIEIIKQIKKVNSDGSYTFGYEAEDGTFKIESRDVLGNVKGTFGFVDQTGEIKRVSYSSSNNGSDSSTLASIEKERVVHHVPKNQKINPTTRRPTIIYPNITPSPSSTVIQTIPRRRSHTKENSTTTTTTTERPAFKYEVSSQRSQSTTEAPHILSPHHRTIYQNGHFIRSTLSPQVDIQRYTEGQLIRPTHPESVTPRPSDSYLRRLIVTRNPLLDEQISSTIKPVAEEQNSDDNVRSNVLRRQLTQEKITDYNTRQHIINLHQSTGSDATDVHSGSLTTGTPRPLFTTTNRPRIQPSAPTTPKGVISPAKYPIIFQKNSIRGPKLLEQYPPESSTDASNIAEANYVTPTPLPQILQIPQDERIQYLQGRPLPRGTFLIPVPVNQVHNRYMYEDPNQEYVQQYIPEQYGREDPQGGYLQPTRVTPIPIIYGRRQPQEEYQRMDAIPDYIRPYPVPVNTNLQDDIDNIKPPVSTLDFQKLLNRLIIRQNHLKEISRIENLKIMQNPYYGPERYNLQPNQVGLFVRQQQQQQPQQNGPIQYIQRANQRYFIPPMQQRMESQQQYFAADPYNQGYEQVPMYRQGRMVGRLMDPNMPNKENENFLPPDVREMLLLKMLQLAINPNLPIPPTEQELMTTANPPHRKESKIRNVQILGEEQEEQEKRRSKRYNEETPEDMVYY